MDFLKFLNETKPEFENIAQTLFTKFAIQTHDTTFRLTEIEFYWHSKNHPDKSTYQRNHVDPKNGEWFFHYSGVDIALKDDETGSYGGILIRGIYDIANNKFYKGPMVCAMRLFSGTNAFSSYIKTQIIPYNFKNADVVKSMRVNLGKNAITSGTDQRYYRFEIDPKKDTRRSN